MTEGLLRTLSRDELQGVVAHEMAHVQNLDVRLMTLLAGMVGAIALMSDGMGRMMRGDAALRGGGGSGGGGRGKGGGNPLALVVLVLWLLTLVVAPIVSRILAMAVSRKREYLADATGAQFTRNPLALASALREARGGRLADTRDHPRRGAPLHRRPGAGLPLDARGLLWPTRWRPTRRSASGSPGCRRWATCRGPRRAARPFRRRRQLSHSRASARAPPRHRPWPCARHSWASSRKTSAWRRETTASSASWMAGSMAVPTRSRMRSTAILGRHLFLVGPGGGERVVDLDRADDPRAERNGLAGEPVGIAEAVPPLVVAAHEGDHVLEVDQRRQDLGADQHVLLDVLVLLVGQRARACSGSPRGSRSCRCRAAGPRSGPPRSPRRAAPRCAATLAERSATRAECPRR